MPTRSRPLSAKLLAAIAVLGLAVLGLIGIVLPVIPGLVFLALAALIVARHVPSVDARLRRHRVLGRHMHRVDRFFGLGLADRMRVAGLVALKGVLDGLDRAADWLGKHASGSRVR
ncbi:MAG TPA: DUF454 family protein [Gammaproteobacteria bacterium]